MKIKIINEVWKPIKNYEGFYEISNLGNVRSLSHMRKNKNGFYIQKGKNIKAGINRKTGYLMVSLSKNGKTQTKYIHKLVAEAFIDNPNNFICVNHLDENKKNNNVDNLGWCNHKINNNYGTRNKRISQKLSRRINQYDLKGNFIKTWNSSIEIEKSIGIDQSNICLCCKGKRNSVGGYLWKYAKSMN